jgi:hypothetical protein
MSLPAPSKLWRKLVIACEVMYPMLAVPAVWPLILTGPETSSLAASVFSFVEVELNALGSTSNPFAMARPSEMETVHCSRFPSQRRVASEPVLAFLGAAATTVQGAAMFAGESTKPSGHSAEPRSTA